MTSCPLCPITRATPGELAAHIHLEHGWKMTKALAEARKAFDGGDSSEAEQLPRNEQVGGSIPPRRATFSRMLLHAATSSDHVAEPPEMVKEPPMPSCGYCHRKDGTHSPNCKKGPCKICAKMAPKKCGFHAGQGIKPGPKGRRKGTDDSGFPGWREPAAQPWISRLKAAIAEHERKAAALREALEILER